jgi:hypothetical protein
VSDKSLRRDAESRQHREGLAEHVGHEPAAPDVHGRRRGTRDVREEDRHAVRDHDGRGDRPVVVTHDDDGVVLAQGVAGLVDRRGVGDPHAVSVHLGHPADRRADEGGHPQAVLHDGPGPVPHVGTQVETPAVGVVGRRGNGRGPRRVGDTAVGRGEHATRRRAEVGDAVRERHGDRPT